MQDLSAILIWDIPVRIFHWLLVLNFIIAYLTGDSEYWRLVHITAGYTIIGLVILRIIWGFVGTRYARFNNFVHSPSAAWNYFRSLASKYPQHYLGHNPAGGLAILGMLGLSIITVISGWVLYSLSEDNELAEEFHEIMANATLGLIILHIIGVIVSSSVHQENLVRAMLTGKKNGQPHQEIPDSYLIIGILLFLAVFCFWVYQW